MKKTITIIALVAIIALTFTALSLTGCDGNPGNPDQNQAPTANAGTDFEHNITTSGTTITLNGSGTDTDGTITAYAWTCTDKPNGSTAPTFSNSAIANPTVSGFDTLGDYEFSLKVKDNENKESSADVVKVSLCMTATKNVEVSFPALVSGTSTLDFTPTYTPAIAGNGFVDGDVVYTVEDNSETKNVWTKETGYIISAVPYSPPLGLHFTQILKINGEEVGQQEIATNILPFGDKVFSGMYLAGDTETLLTAIPSINITLSKKVSAGAIPQIVTKDVTVSFAPFDTNPTSISMVPIYTPNGGWGDFAESDILNKITFSFQTDDHATVYDHSETTITLAQQEALNSGAPPWPCPLYKQTFYYQSIADQNKIGEYTVFIGSFDQEYLDRVKANDNATNPGVYNSGNTNVTALPPAPLTLHLSKQVEK